MKRIRLGKYLTNFGALGALLGIFGVIRQSRELPKDWRLGILWALWLLGLVLAIADVAKRDDDRVYRELNR